jgi:branched-chain amino acid transport system permease protein
MATRATDEHGRRWWLPWLVAACVPALLPLVSSAFNEFWDFFFTEMAILALLGVSFNVVYGYGGKHSFCQGMFYGIGAYVTAWLALRGDVHPLLAVAAATVAASGVAFVAGVVFIRTGPHNFTIATVILGIVAFLAGNTLRWLTGGEDGLNFTLPVAHVAGLAFPPPGMRGKLHLTVAILFVVLFALAWVMRSTAGKIVIAIRENELRAQYLGYGVFTWTLVVFTIGGALAGLAGSLYALTVNHVSTGVFDLGLSINAIVWSVVGGLGTVLGPVVGVLLLLPLSDYLSSLIIYSQIPIGILLVLVVTFAPEGIVGRLSRGPRDVVHVERRPAERSEALIETATPGRATHGH